MNHKFNIKKLVKISVVALAMISAGGVASTINANTNVHADSIASKQMAFVDKIDQKDSVQSKRNDDYAAYHAAKSDPSILAYDLTYAQDRIKGHERELINSLTPSQKATFKKDLSEERGAVDPSAQKYYNHLNKMDMEKLMGTKVTHSSDNVGKSTSTNKATNKSVISRHHRAHLSKAMVRKIMKQIHADKLIVRNDKKQLASCKVRKAYNKYKKTSKKTFYARRYMFFHNDKAEYESKLDHLIKSVHTSKTTKHNARKSLKKVRKSHKNRKNAKRSHKLSHVRRHSRRTRK